jgi:methyltransferase (TIGR00027 family)
MKKGRSSETAMLSAMMRAAHVLQDSEPWIFNDELAAGLAGMEDEASLRRALISFEEELVRIGSAATAQAWMQASRFSLAMRARYAEDELQVAIARGVSQYVILGSGFDSFAYRRRDLADAVQVFEVDHPATQEQKRARLRQLRVEIPRNVAFAPVDFEAQQSILDVLREAGYRHHEPAFFSWLGVIWYLLDDSIDRTLREVASAAGGSGIVLDYLVPEFLLDDERRQILRMSEAAAAARGEQGGRCFEPARMAERLRAAGFARVEDFGSEEGNARYCADRTDGLQIPELLHLAHARVASPQKLR